VRFGGPQDLARILQLERETAHAAHWSEQAYVAAFQPGVPERVILLAEDEDHLQGFVVARFSPPECELENIVVAASVRRQGIASRLFESLISEARKRSAQTILLEVRESNSAARCFYRKLGFRESGCREGYYSEPVEAAIVCILNF
jgi:ribosomal-protein-alanine acetyltransferase